MGGNKRSGRDAVPPAKEQVDEHGVDPALRRAAEQEMRRVLPEGEEDGQDGRPAKRQRAAPLIGRFEYGAPAVLADGAAGFVLTCSMGREHSAMKEAGAALVQQVQRLLSGSEGRAGAKAAEAGSEAVQAEAGAGAAATSAAEPQHMLHSVKLACRGVVALKLSVPEAAQGADAASLVQRAVTAIVKDVESGALPRFRHLQRIIPMQTSAALSVEGLAAAAARLAPAVAAAAAGGREEGDSTKQLSFAVAYMGRGSDFRQGEAAAAAEGGSGGAGQGKQAAGGSGAGSKQSERLAHIGAIADGFTAALKAVDMTAKVNLKEPEWVVLAEVLPLASGAVCGLAAVPASLCQFQARTNVKLVGEQQAAKRGGGKGGGSKGTSGKGGKA